MQNRNIIKTLMLALVCLMSLACNISNSKSFNKPKENIRTIYQISFNEDPNTIQTLEYNASGDLIKQIMPNDTIYYNYKNKTIIKEYSNKKENWLSKIVYQTNASGRIIKSQLFDPSNVEISNYQFDYNSNNYLTKAIHQVGKQNMTNNMEFNYKKENLDKVYIKNSENKIISIYQYEYFYNKINMYNIFIHSILTDLFPNERLGRSNNNMIKSLTQISPNGDTLSKLEYSYPKAQDKNQLIQIETDVLNQNTNKIIYHFSNGKK
ncbi:MAG: hypothetical protein IPI50_16360 [Saprospiraceae bacterium]|nr:hypothetical protein [Saprospiraceae bacterium]